MILLRRFSAILFSICFFVLLFVGLLFNRLTLTLLEPSFYKFQLVDHSIYEFVTHDVFRSLIQDVDDSTAGIFGDDSGKDLYESIAPFSLEPSISNTTLLSAFDVSVDDILISLKRILPPSWLKGETEGVLDVIYYIKGVIYKNTDRNLVFQCHFFKNTIHKGSTKKSHWRTNYAR